MMKVKMKKGKLKETIKGYMKKEGDTSTPAPSTASKAGSYAGEKTEKDKDVDKDPTEPVSKQIPEARL